MIRDAIRNGKRDGTYEVAIDKIGKNGQNYGTRDLILDNWFPTKNDHMLYMNGGRKERARNHIDEFEDFDRPLWPSILEKAFATLAGGYRELDKGESQATSFMLSPAISRRVMSSPIEVRHKPKQRWMR